MSAFAQILRFNPPPPPPSYPNEPAGLTPFMKSTLAALPWVSMEDGSSDAFVSPSSLMTLEATPPVAMPHTKALKHIMAAGTQAGYQEPPGQFASAYLWDDRGVINGANGGPSGTEYSKVYLSYHICVYGNGTNVEIPGNEGMKFPGYMGVTNNNQNASGAGPTQMIIGIQATDPVATSPKTATEFTMGVYTQNGFNQNVLQNMNMSKHVIVGQVHRVELVMEIGTDGGADGLVDMWVDGTQVIHATNVKFIDATYADSTGTGLAGFWGFMWEPFFGGSGGADKTRDDIYYLGEIYASGLFLRDAL